MHDAELLDLLEQSIVYVAPSPAAGLSAGDSVEEDAAAEIRSGTVAGSSSEGAEGDGEVDALDPLDDDHGPSATTVGFVDIAGSPR